MFFLKKRLPRRPHSDQGVATELLWRPIAFLRSSCWRFYALSRRVHCALTTPSLRSHGAHIACTVLSRRLHCAVTAFALCFHGVCTVLTAWHLKKYANIRNCSNQNLNPALKTKTGNNYMCNIKNSQNTREHIVNRVSSYFLKGWPLSN